MGQTKDKPQISYKKESFHYENLTIQYMKSKLRWRTPLQATGYVRATAPNSVKGNNNPNTI